MPVTQAHVKTDNASRYLQQLCKHWSHKFAVTFDERTGKVPFSDDTEARFTADETGLTITLSTEDPDQVERMQEVIADHLERFAFREELEFSWVPVENRP